MAHRVASGETDRVPSPALGVQDQRGLEARAATDVSDNPARRNFRVLTRTRGGYNGSTMYDVQLQSVGTGQLLWARTFTDREQADEFQATVDTDLDLTDNAFRRKHGVPSNG